MCTVCVCVCQHALPCVKMGAMKSCVKRDHPATGIGKGEPAYIWSKDIPGKDVEEVQSSPGAHKSS